MKIIVGDIHGCWDEFQDLLQKVGPGSGDTILAVGDIVDRGPDSRKVAEFFRTTPNARSIQGNHERKHVASSEGRVRPALSQLIVRDQFGADYAALIDFLRTLPLHVRLDEALVVHGFFEPGVPLGSQRETVICGTMSGERYLATRYDRPWYELYKGPPIVVGHRDYGGNGQPFVHRDLVYGLDTQVYAGRALTGLVLPGFRLVSVPARGNHWALARAAYAARAVRTPHDAVSGWERLE